MKEDRKGECSICHKKNMPISNIEVVDCKQRVHHHKDVCFECVDILEQTTDAVIKEE